MLPFIFQNNASAGAEATSGALEINMIASVGLTLIGITLVMIAAFQLIKKLLATPYTYTSWMTIGLTGMIGAGTIVGGISLRTAAPLSDQGADQSSEPSVQSPAPVPAAPDTPMDWNQFAPLVWALGILVALVAAGWVGSAGYRSARRARTAQLVARTEREALAAKWAAASERASQAQMRQSGYEGVPLGNTTAMEAWNLAFAFPEFSNVSRPEHQSMIRALRTMESMRESLRVPGTAPAGTIEMTGTPEQLERFLVVVGEYELAIEANLAHAKRLRDSALPEEIRSLITQSQQILSQIGEGSVLPEAMLAELLGKLDRNVTQINELHGSHLLAPSVVKAIAGKAVQLRELTT